MLDGEVDAPGRNREATTLLHESLECFGRCLTLQEEQFAAQETLKSTDNDQSEVRSNSDNLGEAVEEEIWSSIVEPITNQTLADTCLAQLECLRTLCSIQSRDHANGLSEIQGMYRDNLKGKIDTYSQSPQSQKDAVLGKASFLCSLACTRLRLLYTTFSEYEDEFDLAIQTVTCVSGHHEDATFLSLTADAHVDFNTNIEDRLNQHDETWGTQEIDKTNRLRWKHISTALDQYTTVSKLPKPGNLARIHIKRGDCELLRLRLAQEPSKYGLAIKSYKVILKNARVYYDAAKKVASRDASSIETQSDSDEADLKIALTASWQSATYDTLLKYVQSNAGARGVIGRGLEDMRDQGLLSDESWTRIAQALGQT